MAIIKYSAQEFGAIGAPSGVTLEYAGKSGKNSAIAFTGSDYTVTSGTQGEVLRVVKAVMLAHWLVKDKETALRINNDGIRSKLRATTPYRIHIVDVNGKKVKTYDLAQSEWAKIGLMPTTKDLERSMRDKKQYVHRAAVAMLEALHFRLDLPLEDGKIDKAVEQDLNKAQISADAEKTLAKKVEKEKVVA